MKKIINFTLLSLLVVLFSYSQQQTGGARNSDSPIDLIVLIDTSLNMSGHYREFIDYVSGSFLREFLRIGDTFHILSFSDSPKTEIARRIEGVGDVETIISRLYLLYPLESRRDLNGALDYAGSYIAELPSRPRKLVLFTAGQEAVQFTRPGTDFYPVQFPLTGPLLSSGRPPRPAPAQPSAQTQPRQPATQTQPAAQAQPPAQTQPRQQPATQTQPAAPAQPPAQTQPRQPATQTQPAAQAQPPAQTQPRQPATQTQPAPPAQPQQQPATQAPSAAQAQPQQQPPQTAQAQPRQQPAARTPVVSPDSPAENKPKRNLLQSLIDFFKGIRKQDTEKSPAESAPKGKPIKKEPVQAAPAQPPAQTQPRQPATQTPPAQPQQQPPQTAQAQPRQQPAQTSAQTQPRQQPAARTPDQAKPGATEKGGKFPLWILLPLVFLPAIAVIVFLFFLIRRKLETIPVRSVSYVAGRTIASPPRRDMTAKLDTNPMVYLEVDDQNRNIGRRNTHSLKAGSAYTVGGGKSDFLIFLVPLPPSIGILKFDGKECTFIPKKPRYFPEISGEPVPDCIEKTIRVISDSGYKLSFRFRQYEDPLIALNRTMNSAGTGLS